MPCSKFDGAFTSPASILDRCWNKENHCKVGMQSDQSNAIHISMELPYNRNFWQNGREIRPFFIKIL